MRSTFLPLIAVCLGASACSPQPPPPSSGLAADTIIRVYRDTIIKHSVAGMRDTIIKHVTADCCDEDPRPSWCPPELKRMRMDTIIK